jgi:hypothetical protein
MKSEFFALYVNSLPPVPYIIGFSEVILLQKSVTSLVNNALSVHSPFVISFIVPINPLSLSTYLSANAVDDHKNPIHNTVNTYILIIL